MRHRLSSVAVALAGLWLPTVLAPEARCGPPPPGIPGGEVEAISTPRPIGAVGVAALRQDGPLDLAIAYPGTVELRTIRADGSLAPPLARSVDAAMPEAVLGLFEPEGVGIVDRATRAIALLKVDNSGAVDARHPLVDAGRISLAGDPVAVDSRVIDDGTGAPFQLIAIAERGTRDVEILGAPSAPREDVRLPAPPTSIAVSTDEADTPILAVGTDEGVAIVDASDASIAQRVAVPGGVTSVAFVGPDKDLGITFEADLRPDLVVVRGDGAVELFRGRRPGGVVSPRGTVVGGPSVGAGAGINVVSGEFGGDVAEDFATVSPDGVVAVTFGSVGGRRTAPVVYRTGPTAGPPQVSEIAGDDHDDLVFPASGPDEVRLLPMPGDRQISADATAGGLAGGFGRVLWWRRDPAGGRRLVELMAGVARDLPVRVRSVPVRTIVGRNERGHPAVAFGRCSSRCDAKALDLVTLHELPVRLRLPRSCWAESVAIWGHDVAYGRVFGRGCPRAHRGIWVRRAGQPARRLTAKRGLLGDLDARHVAWVEYGGDSGRAVVDGPAGRHLVGLLQSPGVADWINGSLRGPVFVGRRAWWAEWVSFLSGDTGTLKRSLPDGRGCEATARDLPTHDEELDAVVDRGAVYYADGRGVFRARPDSLGWARERCTSP